MLIRECKMLPQVGNHPSSRVSTFQLVISNMIIIVIMNAMHSIRIEDKAAPLLRMLQAFEEKQQHGHNRCLCYLPLCVFVFVRSFDNVSLFLWLSLALLFGHECLQ